MCRPQCRWNIQAGGREDGCLCEMQKPKEAAPAPLCLGCRHPGSQAPPPGYADHPSPLRPRWGKESLLIVQKDSLWKRMPWYCGEKRKKTQGNPRDGETALPCGCRVPSIDQPALGTDSGRHRHRVRLPGRAIPGHSTFSLLETAPQVFVHLSGAFID